MKFFTSKYFFLLLFFVVIIILIPLFLYGTSGTKRGAGIIPPIIPPLPIFQQVAPTAIPTPILEITQVAPVDKTTDAPLNDPIAIEFSRPVNQAEKAQIRFSLTPVASGDAQWSPDNSQLFFIPSSLLLPQASYSATILFQNRSYSWTFITSSQESITTSTTQQQARTAQASYDDQWAQMQQKLYQNYPWYDLLPLSTESYFVSFDTQQNSLIADLFPKDSNNTIEVNKIKQDVQQALETAGVDLKKINIQWQIH